MAHPHAEFEKHFYYTVGSEMMMNQFKEHTGHQRIRGIRGMGKANNHPLYL
ncbi:MAG: hypothetical protein ACJA1X_002197 [Bermanella sp.]|jgi:hypothetical protein